MTADFTSLEDPKLIKLLKDGAVGVLPTDTVYGLVCLATNKASVERLYKLKNRKNKPGTLIAANIEQLINLGFKGRYLKAFEQFWPGPISVETPSSDASTAYLRQNQPTIALRIPKDAVIHKLLVNVGPLQTTSANAPGDEPCETVEDAKQFFGDKVDFYVNVGPLVGRKHSTIIRMVDDAIEVIREGAVKIDEETGRISK